MDQSKHQQLGILRAVPCTFVKMSMLEVVCRFTVCCNLVRSRLQISATHAPATSLPLSSEAIVLAVASCLSDSTAHIGTDQYQENVSMILEAQIQAKHVSLKADTLVSQSKILCKTDCQSLCGEPQEL